MSEILKVTALAGGVGGAKLADGISRFLAPAPVNVVVNTGDDFELFGLNISPDLDTVCYTLAGLANPETGWGRKEETWHVFETLPTLGAPNWFRLGDHDLALHLERTRLFQKGLTLTEITHIFCKHLGIKDNVLPMTDQSVKTVVKTRDDRSLPFQEYFVKERCNPEVAGFEFVGLEHAHPSAGVKIAIEMADLVIICPSNPWVSIDPIIKLHGVRDSLKSKNVVAVSPIIGGKTVKGPAAKMFSELGISPGVTAVADHYHDFLKGMVLDSIDSAESNALVDRGIIPLVTNTIMKSIADRVTLAKETIEFGINLPS